MRKKPKRPKSTDVRKQGLPYFKSHPLLIPVSTFLVLFFVTLVAIVVTGGQTIGASDSKVVRLHVDGDPRVVPTRAQTVGELLERLDIKVEEKDIVEPGLDAEITEDNFSVNFYKARPVMVVDEGKKTVAVTAQPTPKGVAEEAGVKVYPEDKITEETTDIAANPTKAIQEGLVAEKIIIERATPIKLNLYGKAYDVRTHAETVAQLMEERNVEYSAASVFPDLDALIEEDLVIFVTQPGKKISMIEEIIEPTEETIEDPTLAFGERKVKEKGVAGKKVVIYEISPGGRRKPLQEVVVRKPQKRTVAVGARMVITNPSENVKLGQKMAAEHGWTGQQWYCLYQLWDKESSWGNTARNPYSGAFGIPQGLPLPGRVFPDGYFEGDPVAQISWGLNYISGRHGNPCNAWYQHNGSY